MFFNVVNDIQRLTLTNIPNLTILYNLLIEHFHTTQGMGFGMVLGCAYLEV